MRHWWVSAEIEAPSLIVWELLTDLEVWPRWGPSVRSASVDGEALAAGARGMVVTSLGFSVPFEITTFEPGVAWAWKVGGVDATSHRVDPLGPDRCRAGFGVAWPAAPYLAVCRIALGRLAHLATMPG